MTQYSHNKAAPKRSAATAWAMDQSLLLSILLLAALGVVMVTSASISIADKQLGDPFFFVKRHICYLGLGLLMLLLVQRIPLRFWEKLSAVWVILALALLLAVFLPGLGRTVNGATRWLDLGVIGLQASEPARLCLLLYLAGYLVRHQEQVQTSFQGFFKPMLILGIGCGLILAQPDFGAATVLLLTALGMLFLAGMRWWRFITVLSLMSALFALLAVSSAYRLQRLTGFLDPWADPYNTGFQLTQALIAFGSGGWYGVGLGNSVQKLFYLPEAHNDFLLAVLAEELGLIGVLVVIVLFSLLIWRILTIATHAERQGQLFAAYLSYGLGLWLAIQASINIGVNMGLLPTKGLTLPLLSAGGSSLLITCVGIGLVLRSSIETQLVQRQAYKPPQQTKTDAKRGSTSTTDLQQVAA